MCINCNDPLQINLPAGAQGPAGPPPNFTIGTVTTGSPAAVVIGGTTPDYNLSFTIPAGAAGSNGATGATGAYGGVVFPYTWGNWLNSSTPGTGVINSSAANGASATTLRISVIPSNFTVSSFINNYFNYLSNITSTVKATLKIYKKSDPTTVVVYNVTGLVLGTPTTFYEVTCTPVTQNPNNTPFSLNDEVLIAFAATGDSGAGVPSLVITQTGTQLATVNAATVNYDNMRIDNGGGYTTLLLGATSTTNNATYLPTTGFSSGSGNWTVPTTGVYELSLVINLTSSNSSTGWVTGWTSGFTPTGAIIGRIQDNGGNFYAFNTYLCAGPQKVAHMTMNSGPISLTATTVITCKLFNGSTQNYNGASVGNNDAIRFSVKKLS